MIHDLSASLWWHIYCVNHWYDIAAETLLVLRRSGFPGKIWAEVTVLRATSTNSRTSPGW